MSDPVVPSGAREAARERARELRDKHRKQDRRRRLIVTGSIVLGTLVILAVVATVLVTLGRPTARGPINMISDGIKIGVGLKAQPTAALQPGDRPVASKKNPTNVVGVTLYVDYLCPDCGAFERANGDQLRAFVESGAATVEIHPIAVLTTKSAGSQYSLRAANAAACVAEFSPNRFFDFNQAMFEKQPKENTQGLTDDQIVARAEQAKVTHLGSIRSCVKDQRFRSWVQSATSRALNGPIPGAQVASVKSTPTILVNGAPFTYAAGVDPSEFAQFIQKASGETFDSTPSPSPTPSPTASSAG